MELNCTALLNKNDLFYWSIRKEDISNPNVLEDTNKTTWYAYVACMRCGGECCKNSCVHMTVETLGSWVADGMFKLALTVIIICLLLSLPCSKAMDHADIYCTDLSLKTKSHENFGEDF